jgi:SAM-dependent methyltransferase
MGRPMGNKSRRQPKKGWRTAKSSDINELYELSVQDPAAEVLLLDQFATEQRGVHLKNIREDFCGTCAVAFEWVKHRNQNTAWCVDLDTDVLRWAKDRVPERLGGDELDRIHFIEGDVLATTTPPVDAVLATNFSYYTFKKREDLIGYFRHVHDTLGDDGLFLLDAYGGSDSFLEMTEDRDLDGFTYTWDQSSYNPITGDVVNHIHFKFPDGTKIKRAFTYEWRLWTLPEIREALSDAGFTRIAVYWEGSDEDGDGNGEWTESSDGEACQGWIAYLVASKRDRT